MEECPISPVRKKLSSFRAIALMPSFLSTKWIECGVISSRFSKPRHGILRFLLRGYLVWDILHKAHLHPQHVEPALIYHESMNMMLKNYHDMLVIICNSFKEKFGHQSAIFRTKIQPRVQVG